MRNLEAAQLKPCGLDTIHIELTDPPTQKWTDILIKGNVTVLDEESFLYRLFEKTVKLNTRNIIHCDVSYLLEKDLILVKFDFIFRLIFRHVLR